MPVKLTQEQVIKYFNSVHGVGTYDYSKVDYINNRTKVIIICNIHGIFLQGPSDHKKVMAAINAARLKWHLKRY